MIRFFGRYVVLGVVCLASLFCVAYSVEAKPSSFCPLSGGGESCGRGDHVYHSLTPEKQAACDAIIKEFSKKTQPLREKIMAKQLELQTISNSPNPDRKAIQELSQEIARMHTVLVEEYHKMYEKLEKDVGVRGYHMSGSGAMYRHGIDDGGGVENVKNKGEKANSSPTRPCSSTKPKKSRKK